MDAVIDRVSDHLATAFAMRTLGMPASWCDERIRRLDTPGGLDGIEITTGSGAGFLIVVVGGSDDAIDAALLAEPTRSTAIVLNGAGAVERTRRRRFDRPSCDAGGSLDAMRLDRLSLERQPMWIRPAAGDAAQLRPRDVRVTRPLDAGVEHLLFELHSDLRDIDGMHAGESLDELCKLLLLASADERTTPAGAAIRLQRRHYGSGLELAAAVRDLHRTLVPPLLADRVPADVLTIPLRMSDAAIERVVERLEPWSLLDSDVDLKARAFQRVLGPSIRAGLGQFFTPLEVVRFMIDAIRPRAEERVLDPFAGSGHFLVASGATETHAIEKSDRMIRVAATDALLHDGPRATLHHRDALAPFESLPGLDPESFDVVVTNPPFGSLLRAEAIAPLGPFETAGSRKSVPLEVLGLERSIAFLRPGGRLAIVLPDGVLANASTTPLRRWLLERIDPIAIVGLPAETFTPHGANVRTSILFARTCGRSGADAAVPDAVLAVRADVTARTGTNIAESIRAAFAGDAPSNDGVPRAELRAEQSWTPEHLAAAADASRPGPRSACPPAPMVRIGDLLTERRTFLDPQAHPDHRFLYIGLEHIERDSGEIDVDDLVTGTTIKSRSKVFRSGDVLYGRLRPYLNKVAFIEPELGEGICSGEFLVLVPDAERIDPGFARELLASEFVAPRTANLQTGSSLPRLQARDLFAIEVALPPRDTQRRIADAAAEFRRARMSGRAALDAAPARWLAAVGAAMRTGTEFRDDAGLLDPPPRTPRDRAALPRSVNT